MSLPAILGSGLMSIYGKGSSESTVTGIVPTQGFMFGVIDQMWNGSNMNLQVGQSVMFREKDVVDRIIFNDWPFTVIPEDKVILIEVAIP